MPSEDLHTIEVRSQSPKRVGTVIWLHGLGADGRDFLPILQMWQLEHTWDFVFPEAPVRPVGLNGNMPMRAWYDIGSDMSTKSEDIDASVASIHDLIAKECAEGVPHQRIVLAGFSQGGVVVQRLATTSQHTFAGLLALSTYFAEIEKMQPHFTNTNKRVPYFWGHGRFDPVIPIDRARTAADKLKQHGFAVDWREYDMQHSVDPGEIEDIAQWLNAIGGILVEAP